MILDYGTEVATDFALSPTANAFDLGPKPLDLLAKTDIAAGKPLYMQFQVTEAFTVGSGTPILQMGVAFADAATFLTNPIVAARSGSPYTLDANIPYFIAGQLPLGALFHVPLQQMSRYVTAQGGFTSGVADYMKRFVTALWNQPSFASANFATGKMSARVVEMAANEHGLQGIYQASFKVR